MYKIRAVAAHRKVRTTGTKSCEALNQRVLDASARKAVTRPKVTNQASAFYEQPPRKRWLFYFTGIHGQTNERSLIREPSMSDHKCLLILKF